MTKVLGLQRPLHVGKNSQIIPSAPNMELIFSKLHRFLADILLFSFVSLMFIVAPEMIYFNVGLSIILPEYMKRNLWMHEDANCDRFSQYICKLGQFYWTLWQIFHNLLVGKVLINRRIQQKIDWVRRLSGTSSGFLPGFPTSALAVLYFLRVISLFPLNNFQKRLTRLVSYSNTWFWENSVNKCSLASIC